ncbi:MAG: acyltransferase, partial [Actinomycetota bacterium]|nr:acyltransferase [Actinomycetota bacterium]
VSPAVRAVVAAVASGVDTAAVPSNLDPPLVRAAADRALPFRNGCNNAYKDAGVRSCTSGDPAGATTVVLFGDSHAAQWFPALDAVARQRGWKLVTLTKAVCPPVALPVWSPVLRRPFRECDAWRSAVLERLRAERPALVVFGSARHYSADYRFRMYGPEWLDGLRRMVAEVRATGARVAVLGPMPRFEFNVPECIADHTGDVRACVRPLEATVDAGGAAGERRAAEDAGAGYVDVHPWICTTTTCAVIVGNLLVYRDDNHVTTTYASWLAPVFGEALEAVLASPVPPS